MVRLCFFVLSLLLAVTVELSPAVRARAAELTDPEPRSSIADRDHGPAPLETDQRPPVDRKKADNESIAAENKELTRQLNILKAEADDLKRDRDRLKADLENLDRRFREKGAVVDAVLKNYETLLKEVEGLRTENTKVRADYSAKFAEVVKKTDEFHAANLRLFNATMVLNKFGLKSNPELYADLPSRPVRGKVLAGAGNGLFELSLGGNDGLVKGHKLEVYRVAGNATTHLGRVEVVEASAARSVAKVLPGLQKGDIQKGDEVASQIGFSRAAGRR